MNVYIRQFEPVYEVVRPWRLAGHPKKWIVPHGGAVGLTKALILYAQLYIYIYIYIAYAEHAARLTEPCAAACLCRHATATGCLGHCGLSGGTQAHTHTHTLNLNPKP